MRDTQYAFRGAPDFARIINENPTAACLMVRAGENWGVALVKGADALLDSAVEPWGHGIGQRLVKTLPTVNSGHPTFQLTAERAEVEGCQTLPETWRAYSIVARHEEEFWSFLERWTHQNKTPRVFVTVRAQ